MNVLRKLEDLQPDKPYNGFAQLSVGFHNVECFRVVKNKFGKKSEGTHKSILVELNSEVVFLPQYFWKKIKENDIPVMNEDIEKGERVYLYFGGRQPKSE